MSRSSRSKGRIRALQAERGLSYRAAKRLLDNGGPASAISTRITAVVDAGAAPSRPDGGNADEDWDLPRPTVRELVIPALVDQCDRLTGADPGSTWDNVAAVLPYDLDVLWLGEIAVDEASVELEHIESYEEDTEAFTVTAGATVRLEGTVSKAAAYSADDSYQLSILDADWNEHYAQVQSGPVQVQLQFEAIVLPMAETATLTLTDLTVLELG